TEHLAAVELAKFLRNPDALIVEEMAGGKIELQQIEVEPRSRADGCKLINLGLPPRVRIGCIQRANNLQIPRATTELISGDIVTLFGNPRALQEALLAFRTKSPQKTEEKRVVIFGGGEYGLCLARMLENGPFRTRIIEKSYSRCEYLSRLLKNTTLIHADATSTRILREEQIGEADFFVATSHDDEDNVMTCLQAADLGVPRCITIIHRADYAEVISRSGPRIGIAGAVSPRTATRRDLARFITGEKLHTLAKLPGGVEIVEFNIRKNSPLVGKRVSQVPWPEGSGLVALSRGSTANVPAADDELQEGDIVIALVADQTRKDFSKVIA
ncbi:MAG: NAD-binding protein, partial [Chthoniobacterales bacterium]|nr:NAD-binding protein [Chthoniobacterales bacterium]